MRQPVDPVGYTHSAAGIARVVEQATAKEGPALKKTKEILGDRDRLVGAISPHDDYIYAQRVYVHLFPYIKARHVIIVGVAHKARDYQEVFGKLVFDNFDTWHGPHGPVPISPLRQEILAHLSKDDAIVHDKLESVEHSVEGLIPFLQHYNREASIVPILVPYMSFERAQELALKTARALASAMDKLGLALGQDVAIVISSDAVHYGDRGWGNKNYAEFGTDQAAYDKAVEQDRSLIEQHLVGPIAPLRLHAFFDKLVAEDVQVYRITWCGRFSIPFGLSLLYDVSKIKGATPPAGRLFRYATTLDPGPEDPGVPGLKVTAPADLHHWVGFTSIGYW